jgi:hexokinase
MFIFHFDFQLIIREPLCFLLGTLLLIVLVFCVLFVFVLCLVCLMRRVSLHCPFLISSSVISNIYLQPSTKSRQTNTIIHSPFSYAAMKIKVKYKHWTKLTNKKHNTTQKTKTMSSRVPNKKHRGSRMISYFSICQLHDNVICNYFVRDDIVKHIIMWRVSLHCPFLISSSVISNIYLQPSTKSRQTNTIIHSPFFLRCYENQSEI